MGIVTDIVLPLSLGFIMFSLGLGLTIDDFARVARQPRDFIVGALSQMVLLPSIAFALISFWHLPPELALGVMIIAAAPGGATSNILTAFARGDVALSVSLTAVISLLCVFTIPFIVVFAHEYLLGQSASQDISVTTTALSVFVIVTVPVVVGLICRQVFSQSAVRAEPWARKVAAFLFALVLIGAIYQERANISTYLSQAGLITLTLNVIMMALAYALARLFATGIRQRIAISIECGLQNGTLAIAVSTLMFGGGLATVPAATYSLLMFATALIFIAYVRHKYKKADA